MKKYFLALALLVLPAAAQAACPSACTVTNSSTAMFTMPQNARYLSVKNESATATIAVTFNGGTAALNTAGSYTILPGQSATWSLFVGTIQGGAFDAISSAASSPATIEVH